MKGVPFNHALDRLNNRGKLDDIILELVIAWDKETKLLNQAVADEQKIIDCKTNEEIIELIKEFNKKEKEVRIIINQSMHKYWDFWSQFRTIEKTYRHYSFHAKENLNNNQTSLF